MASWLAVMRVGGAEAGGTGAESAAVRGARPVYERFASDLGVTTMTVGSWRKRFAAARVDALRDGEGPGRPKPGLVLADAERDHLVRWSRRARASQVHCQPSGWPGRRAAAWLVAGFDGQVQRPVGVDDRAMSAPLNEALHAVRQASEC
ncbi:MAG TPA: helix-turn-helix domain-containing protein [Streptosporangiaceae bacterium]|nr:helix-turn-helix domain-containing protein [Streptosporangiaceae bacterium]